MSRLSKTALPNVLGFTMTNLRTVHTYIRAFRLSFPHPLQ